MGVGDIKINVNLCLSCEYSDQKKEKVVPSQASGMNPSTVLGT